VYAMAEKIGENSAAAVDKGDKDPTI
jgi:hypothetical protein